MGSVATQNKELYQQLFQIHALQGICVSGDDSAQIQRSLASMRMRYAHQAESTLKILNWLQQQEPCVQVLHPAAPDSAGHSYWKKSVVANKVLAWSVLFFKAAYDLTAIRKFCDSLQLFKLGFSWGGPISLVMLYQLNAHA